MSKCKSIKLMIAFSFQKVVKKEKNVKENYFLMFGCSMKSIKEN